MIKFVVEDTRLLVVAFRQAQTASCRCEVDAGAYFTDLCSGTSGILSIHSVFPG
jgi:hypothetical protein